MSSAGLFLLKIGVKEKSLDFGLGDITDLRRVSPSACKTGLTSVGGGNEGRGGGLSKGEELEP